MGHDPRTVRCGRRRLCANVTKLYAAGGRSMTTGLRHLEELEAAGYVRREADGGGTFGPTWSLSKLRFDRRLKHG